MNIARAIVEHAIFHNTTVGGAGLNYVGAFIDYATLVSTLPPAANLNALAYVTTTTGIIGINRRVKGYYRCDGVAWNVYETDQAAFDAITTHETTFNHSLFITQAQLDAAIDANAVIFKYRRGYNLTGALIPEYTPVQLASGYFSNYPKIAVTDLNTPTLGIPLADMPNASGAKLLHEGVITLPSGLLDTTAMPLLTPIYATSSGGYSDVFSTVLIGFTLSQSLTPAIYVALQFITKYIEIAFTGITSQVFTHDFKRYSNIIVLDAMGNDITASVLLTHNALKTAVTVTTNVPITGKLICSAN